MKFYKYQKLEEDDFTRVLLLHPSATRDQPLRCTIEHSSRQRFEKSHVEALSYAWGPPHFSETLLCNDDQRILKITPSLGVALRALRDRSQIRTLWCDAICINVSS